MDGNLSVLLAEDEPMIRRSVARFLAARSCEVQCCEAGQQALELAASGSFDVVIADFELPTADGRSLVEALLCCSEHPRMIVISGHSIRPQALEKRDSDGIRYLAKPFDLELLLSLIRDLTEA